jgi:hypothetical protein
MKNIYTTLLFFSVAIVSYSQSFYSYIAKANGVWTNSATWRTQLRTDGVQKHQYIIPTNFTVTINNDLTISGDVEIYISGTMGFSGNLNLHLSNNSAIILINGTISGSSANQKIKIGNEFKYKGNVDGNLTGFWVADMTTGSAPNGFSIFSILPVQFTSFYVNASGNGIQLKWSVDNEVNNSHYEVERSIDGHNWEKAAVVTQSSNTSTNGYSYTDQKVINQVMYYRIRQVDFDGGSTYSAIKTIRLSGIHPAIKIYTSQKEVIVDLNASIKNSIVVNVINNSGQVVKQQAYNNPSSTIKLSVPNTASGIYAIQVTDMKGWSEVKKVLL